LISRLQKKIVAQHSTAQQSKVNTAQHNKVQQNTAKYSEVQQNTAKYSTAHHTTPHHTTPHHTTPHHTTPYHTTPHHTTALFKILSSKKQKHLHHHCHPSVMTSTHTITGLTSMV
jgi:hypothetical protein